MFPASSMQIIKDAIDIALADMKAADRDEAQAIADFCDTNIKAVCPDCGGTGMDPGLTIPKTENDPGQAVECNECRGTGKGPSFHALTGEMGVRNEAIQSKVKAKLKEKKNGKG